MKRYLVAFSLLGLSALASGEPSTPVTLSWMECVQLAARNNPDLLSALAASQSTRAAYLKSYNGVLPQLSLFNTYTEVRAGSDPTIWNLGGTASLDLIDLGQWATIQSTLGLYKQTQANYATASSNALFNLYRTFSGLLYQQDAVRVNTQIRDTWKNNSQMVNLRYQSGRESKGNNMNTQAQLLQAETALQQTQRDVHVAQQQLSQAVGQDHFTAFVVTGTWTADPVPQPRPDFDSFLPSQSNVQAQQAAVEQARANLRIAQSTLLPTLSLNYTQGTIGRSEFPQNPYWTFSGTVNYPLFAGGPTSTYYASQSAERALEKAQQDLRSVRNQTLSDLQNTWSSFAQAQDQVRVQYAFLQAGLQRKDESDIRYQSGLMSYEDWIRVIQDYVNFQQSFLKAEQNLILAWAQWRLAKGDHL